MTPAKYESHLVDAQASVDFSKVAGKTVVITGGMEVPAIRALLCRYTDLYRQEAVAWA